MVTCPRNQDKPLKTLCFQGLFHARENLISASWQTSGKHFESKRRQAQASESGLHGVRTQVSWRPGHVEEGDGQAAGFACHGRLRAGPAASVGRQSIRPLAGHADGDRWVHDLKGGAGALHG